MSMIRLFGGAAADATDSGNQLSNRGTEPLFSAAAIKFVATINDNA
jgi:hypothetical protein